MTYQEITTYDSPNFDKGRQGRGIQGITIHWWGDPEQNPSFEGVCNWLCNPRSQVSAHAVVTGTGRRVAWLVNCEDTAWHAGNYDANLTQIGLELDPRCRDEDYDVAAELIADLWRAYGKLPVVGHSHWSATRCPGNYDLARLVREAEVKLNPPKLVPAPKPVEPAKPTPEPEPEPTPETPKKPENTTPVDTPQTPPQSPQEEENQKTGDDSSNDVKTQEKRENVMKYDDNAINKLNETTAQHNQLANDVAEYDEVKKLVGGIDKRVKLAVYIVGDSLIGAGLILPSLAVAFNFGTLQQIQALSSACATAGAFVLTIFGIYKSGKNK
jgi:internally conserved protein|nr:MAG TPA: N-acetylmuramoyl-L-alanine amidase [Caudoviricetes sp.]